jgi:hypothetical protein
MTCASSMSATCPLRLPMWLTHASLCCRDLAGTLAAGGYAETWQGPVAFV